MGSFAVSRIIDRVARKLLDTAKGRWTAAELLGDYNVVKNAIVGVRPELGAYTEAFQLAVGVKQALPTRGKQYSKVGRNLGIDGLTPGVPVITVDKDDMDHLVPAWNVATAGAVEHAMPDKDNPLIFYVYPACAGRYVELSYFGALVDAGAAGDTFPLPDLYEETVFNGMMAAALSKTTKQGDMQRALVFQQLFNQALGLTDRAQIRFAPKPVAQEQASER